MAGEEALTIWEWHYGVFRVGISPRTYGIY